MWPFKKPDYDLSFQDTAEWHEFLALLAAVMPGGVPRDMVGLRHRVNKITGMQVANAEIMHTVGQWLPRLREIAAERGIAA
ncbi:hypothetical protein [Zavarzinella formosa]|uniref:hypothetical protein n=1 Tax=Zavarzinella formosa TaxID=360055 RepID=UPI0003011BF5|nr:hypothetical protein [Zavarzinella formosa]